MTSRPPQTLVLGGGIVGAATAFHLARGGGAAVRLLERGRIGAGATARSGGILSYQGWDPWDLELVRESADAYRHLYDATGLGRLAVTGGVRVARTAEGAAWLAALAETLARERLEAPLLGAREAAELLPWADLEDVVGALHTPDDATLAAEEATVGFARRAVRSGAELLEEQGALRVERAAAGWTVEGRSGTWEADELVVCAGAWTGGLLGSLGVRVPLVPFRAQASVVRPRPLVGPGAALHDLDLNLYVRPWAPGRILLGDGTEPDAADPEAAPTSDAGWVARSCAALGRVATGWTSLVPERSWSGTCVATPDRFPLVGPVPGSDGLYVASGFHGFGTMRAPALARRLAEGIRSGVWDALRPADPRRFAEGVPPFAPRPQFPLEPPAVSAPRHGPRPVGENPPIAASIQDGTYAFEPIADPGAFLSRPRLSLSDWFDPFLGRFVADALESGGSVELAVADGTVAGLFVGSPAEPVTSVFTRARSVAAHYAAEAPPGGVYSEVEGAVPGATGLEVLAGDLRDWVLVEPIRNPVRLATPEDRPAVRELLEELVGRVDPRWWASVPRADELCFVCEVDGRVAGVSWATVAGRHARGHSFAVRPRYRGLGIGTDLLHGRMLYLQAQGVQDVVSEIYAENTASRTAAERAGMSVVGRMYHLPGPPAGRASSS